MDHFGPDIGVMTVTQMNATTFRVTFAPLAPPAGPARIIGVVLADSLRLKVGAGENRGRALDHAFAALAMRESALHIDSGVYQGTITLQKPIHVGRLHVAFRVTQGHNLQPLQAEGGPRQ